ncbi:MAG: hypothetical protein AAGJ80_10500 [Cyanobacteria bacterium J06553_1]
MAQPSKAPLGGVKWKALFDNNNPICNKILFCNTHTAELLPWYGFVRRKDFTYTCIPLSNEQHTIINNVETQVEKILAQHEWSGSFKLTPTQKIFPKAESCEFFEKRKDGCLHRINPDIEGELHNSQEKSLNVGALLQVTGVFFDFATHAAKLTFKLVSATYAWTLHSTNKEDIVTSYLSVFGPIAPPSPPPPQPQVQTSAMDIVEAAAAVSGIATTTPQHEPLDKESFLASLSKIRTVGGIHRRMRQLQKLEMEVGLREWCEHEARRVMYDITNKQEEKKRRKEAAAEEMEEPTSKKVKPFTLQRQNNGTSQFKVIMEQSNDSLAQILDTDDEDEDVE